MNATCRGPFWGEAQGRAEYCQRTCGVNNDGYIASQEGGNAANPQELTLVSDWGERGQICREQI
ncbi:hypothetical protein SJI19_14685 [Acerihabitans sp. TG2]|uniref:hypothetical protein n=1 Tax=Acerihabitans sp. TG2 TaxID=3096008 RepID=UPI002B2270AA|nr:hypothetical protein [Acerihabitans sp. TG2]MEA9391772.1 hypothetical protein [Acerihabitans sp. TG2]